jgi:hypothetical protein
LETRIVAFLVVGIARSVVAELNLGKDRLTVERDGTRRERSRTVGRIMAAIGTRRPLRRTGSGEPDVVAFAVIGVLAGVVAEVGGHRRRLVDLALVGELVAGRREGQPRHAERTDKRKNSETSAYKAHATLLRPRPRALNTIVARNSPASEGRARQISV